MSLLGVQFRAHQKCVTMETIVGNTERKSGITNNMFFFYENVILIVTGITTTEEELS